MTALAKTRFAQIVLPRMDEGYRLARWLTGSATDAEDVVQDACLKAYRSIEHFADGNARAWFLTIVRNSTYTWLRKNRPAAISFIEDLDDTTRASLDVGHALLDVPSTPEEVLIAKTEAVRLSKAVAALPVHFREAIVLREYHGLSYREIAEVTSVPIGTVMSRLANGRRHLAKWAKEGSA
jgi:RNA polymerase sigma-70 factor (ECF subfamily)